MLNSKPLSQHIISAIPALATCFESFFSYYPHAPHYISILFAKVALFNAAVEPKRGIYWSGGKRLGTHCLEICLRNNTGW